MSPWQLLLQLGAEIVAALVTAFLLAQAHGRWRGFGLCTIRILRPARFQGRVFPACGWVQQPNLLS